MRPRFRKLLARVYRRLTFYTRGEFPPVYFDIWNLHELNHLLEAHGALPITADPHRAADSVGAATRFLFAQLASQPKLRDRFPDFFRAGPTGAGARWFAGEGARELGLSPVAVENSLVAPHVKAPNTASSMAAVVA